MIAVGSLPGLLVWSNNLKDTLNYPPNSGYRPYITRFNTQTGKVLGIDKLETDKANSYPDLSISDGRNNIYVGGNFGSQLTVNGKLLQSAGGRDDWFVAKYGHNNCNCSDIPEPKFTYTKNKLNDITFSYTGGSYKTIEWDFDDGSTSSQTTPNHVYNSGGSYTVCVKVTNDCGDNVYCEVLDTWPVSVSSTKSVADIDIYPNPADNVLYIEGLTAGSSISVHDLSGRMVHQTTATTGRIVLAIHSYAAGTYLVYLRDATGNRHVTRIVKQ